jgi:hypothetical protein
MCLRVLQSTICVFIGATIISTLNKWIVKQCVNNFVHDPSWNWSEELAVVTGGSSGIGASIVRGLARMKVRTIVLDINPPNDRLGACYTTLSAIPAPITNLKQKRE